jgi:hypothetical protein
MSSFTPARPRYTLPFAGKDYDLIGTLEVIEAIEDAFREGVVKTTMRIMDMGVTETAKLAAAVCTACGHTLNAREAAGAIYDSGVNGPAFTALKIHLFAFLRTALEPPELREAMAKKMGEIVGKLAPASPGDNTKSSASGFSAGSQSLSGEPPLGT